MAARGVFAARGKRLCCRPVPTHPVAYLQVCRNLKGTFQVYIFKNVHILAYFFTVNIIQFFFTSNVPRRTPLDTPLVPPIRSAIDILMVTSMAMVWNCGLENDTVMGNAVIPR